MAEMLPKGRLSDDENGMSDEEMSAETAISNAVALLGGEVGAVMVVYRASRTREQAYLFECHPDDFSFEELREKYGGGIYRIWLYRIVDGVKTMVTNRKISIEGPITPTPQNNNNQMSEGFAALLQGMSQGFQHLGEMMVTSNQRMAEMIASNRPKEVDPMAMQAQMIAMMVSMKELMGGVGNKTGSDIELLMKGLELGKELSPPSDKETTTSDVLIEGLKAIGPALTTALQANQMGARQMQTQMATPRIPQQINMPVSQTLPAIHSQQEVAMQADTNIGQYIGVLISKAETNAPTGIYADLILDNVPHDVIIKVLERPNPIEYLEAFDSRVSAHKQWFANLLADVNEGLTYPPESAINMGNTGLNSDLPHVHFPPDDGNPAGDS